MQPLQFKHASIPAMDRSGERFDENPRASRAAAELPDRRVLIARGGIASTGLSFAETSACGPRRVGSAASSSDPRAGGVRDSGAQAATFRPRERRKTPNASSRQSSWPIGHPCRTTMNWHPARRGLGNVAPSSDKPVRR